MILQTVVLWGKHYWWEEMDGQLRLVRAAWVQS